MNVANCQNQSTDIYLTARENAIENWNKNGIKKNTDSKSMHSRAGMAATPRALFAAVALAMGIRFVMPAVPPRSVETLSVPRADIKSICQAGIQAGDESERTSSTASKRPTGALPHSRATTCPMSSQPGPYGNMSHWIKINPFMAIQ